MRDPKRAFSHFKWWDRHLKMGKAGPSDADVILHKATCKGRTYGKVLVLEGKDKNYRPRAYGQLWCLWALAMNSSLALKVDVYIVKADWPSKDGTTLFEDVNDLIALAPKGPGRVDVARVDSSVNYRTASGLKWETVEFIPWVQTWWDAD